MKINLETTAFVFPGQGSQAVGEGHASHWVNLNLVNSRDLILDWILHRADIYCW